FSRYHDEAQTAEAVIIELDEAGLDQIDGVLVPVVHLGDTPPAYDAPTLRHATRVTGRQDHLRERLGAGRIHDITLQEKKPREPERRLSVLHQVQRRLMPAGMTPNDPRPSPGTATLRPVSRFSRRRPY